MKHFNRLLKISAVLWGVWGVVHVLAGLLTMKFVLSGDVSSSIGGIADKVDGTTLQMDYPAALGAIIGQHGFNLFWIGVVTLICAIYIWKENKNAIFLAALTGGLADLGYFLFLDLGGYVNFLPGSLMTYISASAILLSFYAYFRGGIQDASRL
ncbi:hypothetical protein [Lewinella sp. LCG006]|uniref:hypothetical protein n=1 Tax=Lewinella sp. LCG006 TaxID=3231911 RepID=UPI003460D077